MTTLNKLFTEEDAVVISEKVLASTRDKIKEQIANKVYEEVEGFLYEMYQNNKSKIHGELIAEISEQYISDPTNYKFKSLRDKIWAENKPEIVASLTNGAITEAMENILYEYTHRDYMFSWKWKDGIVKLVLSNWDKFKDDERITQGFGREIENLKSQISSLQNKLNEASSALNEY